MIMIALIYLYAIFCTASTLPTTSIESKESLDIIYVPYDLKFLPVEFNKQDLASKDYVLVPGPVLKDLKFLPVEVNKEQDLASKDVLVPGSVLKDLKFLPVEVNKEQDLASKNDVLVPGSVLKDLKFLSIEVNKEQDLVSKNDVLVPGSVLDLHRRSKRQAVDDGFFVYNPVVRVQRQVRDRRKILRRPALVGYLNSYDQFPTVA